MQKLRVAIFTLLTAGVFVSSHAAELVVTDGGSIMQAVRAAKPGDTIKVMPGEYKETVYVDKNDLTIKGVIVGGKWPRLEGNDELSDGFLVAGSNIVIENFHIANHRSNGIMLQGATNFVIRNNVVEHSGGNGVYGIFPMAARNGAIEYNVALGWLDAGLYCGMCENVDIRFNEFYDNGSGIQVENSHNVLVEANATHDNMNGIAIVMITGWKIKTISGIIVRNNILYNNNKPNEVPVDSVFSLITPGTGVFVFGADGTIFENNVFNGNVTAAIVITDHRVATERGLIAIDPETDPNPDKIQVLRNLYWNNGMAPVGYVKEYVEQRAVGTGKTLADIVAIGGGSNNCLSEPKSVTAIGTDDWTICPDDLSTQDVQTMRLQDPLPIVEIPLEEKGEFVYRAVCSGCHASGLRLIGPNFDLVRQVYKGRPEALAEYITSPTKKYPTYPPMPPQDYLPEEVRLEVARYVLEMGRDG